MAVQINQEQKPLNKLATLSMFMFISLVTSLSVSTWANELQSNSRVPQGRHISVIGQAEVKAEPDKAVINLTVEATETTSLSAKKTVDETVNRFIDGLSRLGVAKEKVVASSIYTQPQYQYQSNGPRILTGYRATRQLTVDIDDLAMVNAVMDLSLKEQINQINGIELSSSKSHELKRQATLLATQNATQQGRWLAQAFNAELGAIYSIDAIEPTNFDGMLNQPNRTMTRMETSNRTAGQYIHKELVFSATVKAVFDLKVKH